MYDMNWDIRFDNAGKKFRLGLLASLKINCSVDNLADVAEITLPEAVMNQVLSLEASIPRGTSLIIKLGYDGQLEKEFEGFIQDITTNDSTLKILCEDALFLFRKSVKDLELKPTSIKAIAQYLVNQIDPSFKVSCDYNISYEKFTIHQATGYDVLKKLQEETKANIYFDTSNKILHIHPPYIEKGADVVYSMHRNIEKSSLEYKRAIDKKVEVTIESTNIKGKVTSIKRGTTGGDSITLKVGPMTAAAMEEIAAAALRKNNFDGFAGTFDGWLVPFVRPGDSAHYIDLDYPHKKGTYYVVGVETTFDESGGKRTITPGIKLG
ncbi:hypothetical protein FNO01nite_30540 [Flavobacterium noncentrifugens]|uniref:Phage protein D n=1 Tax=Flavobacterium noncentrifugens TaxID=1128970 RepID=A0A1G9BVD8_9FLAO|nr:hypothetical protein [Flavobacterium noncentrifugens]GEP52382.1 hypothetical protein FNO01nite_30540 [Flavobacterium noncentrifugens]SDK43406.1 hypothetical protein SAMN04487935_3368 [Flavobacterium noncentrifugens]